MNLQAVEKYDWIPRGLADRVEVSIPLAPVTWFRVGGPAQIMFRPKTVPELVQFLQAIPPELSRVPIGVGSNLLVRDGGISGVVIRLAGDFASIELQQDNRVRAGAAALDVAVARFAAKSGIAGLEFLRGIPGTIGGALRMNAGAYGRETKDVLVEATAIDRFGVVQCLSLADLKYSYRHSGADADLIFVEALLQGEPGDANEIAQRMNDITDARAASQPVKSRTGGSTFKNPPADLSGGRRAWELIDEAGCRGLKVGDAQVSEQHCNFLINLGNASSSDLETLGEEVRRRVKDKTGVALDWEIKRLGQESEDE